MKTYYVYIMASRSRRLYAGVTNDLARRVAEHKGKRAHGFTAKYNIYRLVYFEETNDVREAIAQEKQIKGGCEIRRSLLSSRSIRLGRTWARTLGIQQILRGACPERSEGF